MSQAPPPPPAPRDPIAELNAALAERYIIDRELGRGGMAVVYLARDLKHERFVALKTLRPEVAVAVGRDRFLREIRLAARLQHPNILAVYDSGQAAGELYYVMPFVEGESLRNRLDREPQLPLDDALQITREVADALSYAHDHDVVHRDIKPENILLSGGHAIVADFGIARAISAAGGDKLTETGLGIGTPSYMSPEQAAGTARVDRRSDIYSLACVLYEMLAGQPPFTGPTAQAILARHSLDSVPRLKIVRETIPDALEEVINRALAKVPADRHQTAAQFAAALADASTGTVSRVTAARPSGSRGFPWRMRKPVVVITVPLLAMLAVGVWVVRGGGHRRSGENVGGGLDPRRVAVLYFHDLSPDRSLGYLADGLTEALIGELSRVPVLRVVSPNGIEPFRGPDVRRDSVATALEAGTLVEGSVEPVAQRIRVTVRLVDGASGADIRRRSFEVPGGAELTARDSLARQAADFLRTRLGEEIRLREQQASTASVTAWTLVQRAERARKDARAASRSGDRQTALARAAAAESLLALAERDDPDWSEPVMVRGWVARDRARLLPDRGEQIAALRAGLAHAERSLRKVPGDALSLELRGTIRYSLWRLTAATPGASLDDLAQQARQDLEDAVRANPTLATAYATLSLLHHYQNDIVSSVLAARNAYQADAYLSSADAILNRLFYGSYNIMQFAEARRWCREGARRFPSDYRFVQCELMLLVTPDARPDVERAWSLSRRTESLAPEQSRAFVRRHAKMFVGGVIGLAGMKDSAHRTMVRARGSYGIDPAQELVGYEAAMRALLHEGDSAVALLRQYVAANPSHSFEVGGDVHWWWRDLQDHPGFRAVLGFNR